MPAEKVVEMMIHGELYVPNEFKELVSEYRSYSVERGECVSYPRHLDEEANAIFDLLVESVS